VSEIERRIAEGEAPAQVLPTGGRSIDFEDVPMTADGFRVNAFFS
jgi:hypothetical protein